jgi:hypothetical protein
MNNRHTTAPGLRPHDPLVFRQVSIPAPLFDHLKDCQRAYEEHTGEHLTNSKVLAMILREHREMTLAGAKA